MGVDLGHRWQALQQLSGALRRLLLELFPRELHLSVIFLPLQVVTMALEAVWQGRRGSSKAGALNDCGWGRRMCSR